MTIKNTSRSERPANPTVVASFIAVTVMGVALQHTLGLRSGALLDLLTVFGGGVFIVFRIHERLLPERPFGLANHVTLIRFALVSLLIALIGEGGSSTLAWLISATATVALMTDGIDGWAARRRAENTSFGERFDLETDALLILAMCLLSWEHGKAGVWILASGLMRYVFVVAGYAFPWLERPLLPSLRRKVICVSQTAALTVVMLPVVPVRISEAIALLSLLLLTWSFAVDVSWLKRTQPDDFSPEERRTL